MRTSVPGIGMPHATIAVAPAAPAPAGTARPSRCSSRWSTQSTLKGSPFARRRDALDVLGHAVARLESSGAQPVRREALEELALARPADHLAAADSVFSVLRSTPSMSRARTALAQWLRPKFGIHVVVPRKSVIAHKRIFGSRTQCAGDISTVGRCCASGVTRPLKSPRSWYSGSQLTPTSSGVIESATSFAAMYSRIARCVWATAFCAPVLPLVNWRYASDSPATIAGADSVSSPASSSVVASAQSRGSARTRGARSSDVTTRRAAAARTMRATRSA
jgi:hypothetical protein